MSKTYSLEEAQQRIAELAKTKTPEPYDHFRIDRINPADPNSRVNVLGRRHDDHTIEDKV